MNTGDDYFNITASIKRVFTGSYENYVTDIFADVIWESWNVSPIFLIKHMAIANLMIKYSLSVVRKTMLIKWSVHELMNIGSADFVSLQEIANPKKMNIKIYVAYLWPDYTDD